MRVVVALGGNAMTGPDGSARPEDQIAAAETATRAVATLLAEGWEVVLTHGNGPQVGNLLVKNQLAAHVVPPVPLDWCVAQTQGTLGFVLLDALDAALAAAGVERRTATVVTRTLVDADDSGFATPSKPVGRYVTADEARVMTEHGETWEDRGERGWRRVVASPEPLEIVDAGAVRALVDAGYVVVAAGGGGVPVVRAADGTLHGVEAVVDKDLAAALLAVEVGADVLVIATDVPQVVAGWGTDHERPLRQVCRRDLRALADAGEFAAGSMGPKVEALLRYVARAGSHAAICALDDIAAAVDGGAGTVVSADDESFLDPDD